MSKKIDNSNVGVRSNHNLSFNWLGSADFARLVPFHWQELLPTDHVKRCRPIINMQMLPLASPTFSKMSIYCHYFFVPTRCIWKAFPDFISNTGIYKSFMPPYWSRRDFVKFLQHPSMVATSGAQRAFFKHFTSFGLPPFWQGVSYSSVDNVPDNDRISVLPFRAYNQVWWDFYRDTEVLRDESAPSYGIKLNANQDTGRESIDVASVLAHYSPRVRSLKNNWIADLFSEQGGSLSPFGVSLAGSDVNPGLHVTTGSNIATNGSVAYQNVTGASSVGTTSIGEVTPQQLRKIEAVTRLAERLSLSGKRQIDQLFARYGVKPEFSKLNMAQYVGGGKTSVRIQDITSTADTATDSGSGTPLGQKASSGYAALADLNIEYTATEHGYLIGILSVMPDYHYVQGLSKRWQKSVREDWFTREFEHVGQVAVAKKEIGVNYYGYDHSTQYTEADDDKTFAFTQPYYDYKVGQDVLAGDFMWYHDAANQGDEDTDSMLAYMQSMGLWADYHKDRNFNYESLLVPTQQLNNIFWYLGGALWSDTDDHFHFDIDVDCMIDRPMDGYAVPTLETTANPHLATTQLKGSVQL